MVRIRLKVKSTEKFQNMCWVCGKNVGSNDIYAIKGKDKFGNIITRHGKCEVGSAKWLKSDSVKNSKFYKFYIKKEN